jgi:hypothetical protein
MVEAEYLHYPAMRAALGDLSRPYEIPPHNLFFHSIVFLKRLPNLAEDPKRTGGVHACVRAPAGARALVHISLLCRMESIHGTVRLAGRSGNTKATEAYQDFLWAATLFTVSSGSVVMSTVHHSIHDGPPLEFIAADV